MITKEAMPPPVGDPAGRIDFVGTIQPPRLSMSYRGALLLVAIAMLLLPLLFMGLIAAVAFGVGWHLVSNTWLLDLPTTVSVIGYLGPAVVGTVLVFFLFKPVLARAASGSEPLALSRGREPVLFDLIDRICAQVGAPAPARVQVDCAVNAAAGLTSLLPGLSRRRLVLTIGLPLAAGLSARQFAGVLAHEFGHFAQGGGMRLTAVVRGLNAWFYRVVYERDQWDLKLERWSNESDAWFAVVLMGARAMVWFSRRILSAFFYVGSALSAGMLRQMEYDADSYEIEIAGGLTFVETLKRLRELNLAAGMAYGEARHAWLHRRRLPAHLPAFMVARVAGIPQEFLEQVRTHVEEPGLFDTHPTDADRLRAAERTACDGVLIGGDFPARDLFGDFDAVSAEATCNHYRQDLGLRLEEVTLVSTADALDESSTLLDTRQALGRFFHDGLSILRPLDLPWDEHAGLDAGLLERRWREAREQMGRLEGELAAKYRRLESLETTRQRARWAEELLDAGVDSLGDPAVFELVEGTAEEARAAVARAVEQQQELAAEFAAFESAAGCRLVCAVRLATQGEGRSCDDPEPSASAGAAAADREALLLVATVRSLAIALPQAQEARWQLQLHGLLESTQEPSGSAGQFAYATSIASVRCSKALGQVAAALGSAPCPPPDEERSLAAALGLAPGGTTNVDELFERGLTLYFSALGRLAATALQAEARLDARASRPAERDGRRLP